MTAKGIKVILKNNFHNTETVAIGKLIDSSNGYITILLSKETLQRAEKKLCGISDCQCCKIDTVKSYVKGDCKVIIEKEY